MRERREPAYNNFEKMEKEGINTSQISKNLFI